MREEDESNTPACWQWTTRPEVRLRLVVVRDDRMRARCRGCGREKRANGVRRPPRQPIPLSLSPETARRTLASPRVLCPTVALSSSGFHVPLLSGCRVSDACTAVREWSEVVGGEYDGASRAASLHRDGRDLSRTRDLSAVPAPTPAHARLRRSHDAPKMTLISNSKVEAG